MLSDVELFVVTWFLAGVGFLSLFGFAYSSMQLWLLKTNQQITGQGFPKDSRLTEKGAIRLRYLSILILILSSLAGGIISFVNIIPPTEYDLDTVLFRASSPDLAIFLLLLAFGGLINYVLHGAVRGNQVFAANR